MGRTKKAARASRTNGARAKNKGKAKITTAVVVCDDRAAGGLLVSTEQRAKLPKGYVAYESEIHAYKACVAASGVHRDKTPHDKALSFAERHRARIEEQEAIEKDALKMAVDGKGTDAGAKIASLKTLAEGSDVPVVFKDSAAKQPPRRRRK